MSNIEAWSRKSFGIWKIGAPIASTILAKAISSYLGLQIQF